MRYRVCYYSGHVKYMKWFFWWCKMGRNALKQFSPCPTQKWLNDAIKPGVYHKGGQNITDIFNKISKIKYQQEKL